MTSSLNAQRWLVPAVVAGCLAAIGLGFYVVQLDDEVRTRFAGARWTLPAQVYAAPLELYPGLALNRAQLQQELQRLGYRGLATLDGTGTYVVGPSDSIDLLTRHFVFWDGPQPPTRLQIGFEGERVARIINLDTKRPVQLFRLDPLLVGSIHPAQNDEDRVLVKLDDVPPLLPAGLILVEDRSFEDHFGIDPKGILRAAGANLLAGRVVQGGSTLTQQLVKNFFLNDERSWWRKFNEVIMALLLEAHYEKHEIMEAYLNEVYLGQDGERAVHGFGLASQFYFNKPLGELRVQEIALLVALVKGPSFYNPRRQPERAKERRDLVLGLFAEAGALTPEQLQQAQAAPLELAGKTGQGSDRYPAFVDLVRRQLRGQYIDTDLTAVGMHIFTTIDPRVQEALETAIAEGLTRIETGRKLPAGSLQAAGVVTSPDSGQVLALAGGRDSRYAGFNRALDAQRPIGSLVKPFVYLAALMQPERFNLHSLIEDEAIELTLSRDNVWTPQNYDNVSHGSVPLYVALAQSYNLATVRLGLEVGLESVTAALVAAGYPGQPDPLPSILLGALDLSPADVAQLYTTLASSGYRAPLLSIREVLNQDGLPIARYAFNVQSALPEGPMYLLNWAMEQVMIFGTGQSVSNYLPPALRVAGKTGTTDGLRDSWFAGYGADKVAVIWVGHDDNSPTGLTGASGALQIWAPLMRDLNVRGLDPLLPDDVEEGLADPVTGLLADDHCSNAITVPYLRGYLPDDYAPCADDNTPLRFLRRIFR